MPDHARTRLRGAKKKANATKERWSSPYPRRPRAQRTSSSGRRINYAESDASDSEEDVFILEQDSTPNPKEAATPNIVLATQRVVVQEGPEGSVSKIFKGRVPLEVWAFPSSISISPIPILYTSAFHIPIHQQICVSHDSRLLHGENLPSSLPLYNPLSL